MTVDVACNELWWWTDAINSCPDAEGLSDEVQSTDTWSLQIPPSLLRVSFWGHFAYLFAYKIIKPPQYLYETLEIKTSLTFKEELKLAVFEPGHKVYLYKSITQMLTSPWVYGSRLELPGARTPFTISWAGKSTLTSKKEDITNILGFFASCGFCGPAQC